MAEESTPGPKEKSNEPPRLPETTPADELRGRLGDLMHRVERRRQALVAIGWASVAAFVGVYALALVRFFFPRVLFEPPTEFKAGYPSEYTVGAVDTNYQKSQRVWIVREPEGIYALLAKCTHLGCTPVWKEAENKFKCPCHGSGFTKEGINYEGPAPRPLERLKIVLAEDGQLKIDKSVSYLHEKGDWEKPGSILKV